MINKRLGIYLYYALFKTNIPLFTKKIFITNNKLLSKNNK